MGRCCTPLLCGTLKNKSVAGEGGVCQRRGDLHAQASALGYQQGQKCPLVPQSAEGKWEKSLKALLLKNLTSLGFCEPAADGGSTRGKDNVTFPFPSRLSLQPPL